ncbi:MAG: L-histidine N(alpha)-methyltransferase [Chloroflexota bacterium]
MEDVRRGLTSTPKETEPRWFYDERGSELFEAITRLPEYYQTRTEAAILSRCAADIAATVRPEVLVELGAGSSAKTRPLLDAGRRPGTLRTYVPLDVSADFVRASCVTLRHQYPGLMVREVVGDFRTDLGLLPRLGRQLVIFLGSTIGNLDAASRARFLSDVRKVLATEDAFLVGMDLAKNEAELLAAYNDARGVTADFNLNLLRVLNRELDANFSLKAFEHVALYDRAEHRIEMHLRSARDQRVEIPAAGLAIAFARGEHMRTEISVKFTREIAAAELAAAGLRLAEWYTDEDERFAVVLARPA